MTRKLATYTRSGFDRDHVLVRSFLPAVAGHNLLMGAELLLADGGNGVPPPAEVGAPSEAMPVAALSVEAKLKRVIRPYAAGHL
jgi:hypothetical protein